MYLLSYIKNYWLPRRLPTQFCKIYKLLFFNCGVKFLKSEECFIASVIRFQSIVLELYLTGPLFSTITTEFAEKKIFLRCSQASLSKYEKILKILIALCHPVSIVLFTFRENRKRKAS